MIRQQWSSVGGFDDQLDAGQDSGFAVLPAGDGDREGCFTGGYGGSVSLEACQFFVDGDFQVNGSMKARVPSQCAPDLIDRVVGQGGGFGVERDGDGILDREVERPGVDESLYGGCVTVSEQATLEDEFDGLGGHIDGHSESDRRGGSVDDHCLVGQDSDDGSISLAAVLGVDGASWFV